MSFKKVNVKLHHLFTQEHGEDPGDGLEIYGRLDVSRLVFNPDIGDNVTLDAVNLWDRGDNNPQDILEGTAHIIDKQVTLTVSSGEHLWFTGFLSDHDTFGPNDHLGNIDHKIAFEHIGTRVVDLPRLQEGDQQLDVKISTFVVEQG